MTRILGFFVHNWPLKLAAVALASLLYGGLVLSQSTDTFTSPVRIDLANPPGDVIVLSNPGSVTRIEYVAPPDLGLRIDASTFEAFVDLTDVDPSDGSVSLDVTVRSVDERVQVLGFEPQRIVLNLDRRDTKTVPVRAELAGPAPSGLETGEPTVDAETATVTGPATIVAGIVEARANVVIDGSGIDVDDLFTLVAVDESGAEVGADARVEVEPAAVRVHVPIFTDLRSKSLPVAPNVAGTPAAGFEVAAVEFEPTVVNVQGDANDLAGLERADTEPVSVAGASSTVTQVVALDLPEGVQALGSGTVQVRVFLRPITGTRTLEAGVVLSGARADRVYRLSVEQVLVTIGGALADLDRLSGSTLILSADVTGLEVGTHEVSLSANLTTGLALLRTTPEVVEVTITAPALPTAPSPGPSGGP